MVLSSFVRLIDGVFVGFILPTLKAYVVCIAEGTMKMVTIVNTSIDVQSLP